MPYLLKSSDQFVLAVLTQFLLIFTLIYYLHFRPLFQLNERATYAEHLRFQKLTKRITLLW